MELNAVITTFEEVLVGGRSGVSGIANSLLVKLIIIDLVFLGAWAGLKGENVLPAFLKRVLVIAFFQFLISNWTYFLHAATSYAMEVSGNAAGSGSIRDMLDPGYVLRAGADAIRPFRDQISGWDWYNSIMAIIAVIIIMAAYAVLAFTLLLTTIEFYLISTLALALLPFGVLRHTAFLAERSFAAVIAFAVKLMVLFFIAEIGGTLMEEITSIEKVGDEYELGDNDYVIVPLTAFGIAILALHAPGVASALLTAAPSLNGGAALGTMSAGASAMRFGGATVGVGLRAMGGALQVLSAAGKGGASGGAAKNGSGPSRGAGMTPGTSTEGKGTHGKSEEWTSKVTEEMGQRFGGGNNKAAGIRSNAGMNP